jgi:hypothetical protein
MLAGGARSRVTGVGSESTVTQAPSGGPLSPVPPRLPPQVAEELGNRAPEGTSPRQDTLFSRQPGPLPASPVVSIANMPGVTAAVGRATAGCRVCWRSSWWAGWGGGDGGCGCSGGGLRLADAR